MKRTAQFVLVAMVLVIMTGCIMEGNKEKINSPNGKLLLEFMLSGKGEPTYRLHHKGEMIIDTSFLGFDFKNAPSVKDGWEILTARESIHDDSWEMPWGEQKIVRNNYNELVIELKETEAPHRVMTMTFRLYNDGLGFRYIFPEQENWEEALIMDENTQFNLTGDHQCWWIPGDWDIYEHLYNTTKFTEIDAISKRSNDNLAQTHIPENAVNTPVTMRTDKGLHLSFHEADLTDYAGMTLKINKEKLIMQSELVGSERLGYKVKHSLPFKTPWRTIQVSEDAGGLIESKLIVNLNEPNKLGDIDWFEPMKYAGIWWEMHLGKSTWDMGATQDMNTVTGKKTSTTHGATTEHAKELIDFAAANNIGGVLVEGWNTGWEHWIGFEDREGVFDFVTPYPDYDLKEVANYASKKGAQLIMHHETSAAPRTYEQQLDTAYQLMEELGIHVVKTGYVGQIIPKGEFHHGQWMVNHYRKVLETGAEYKVAINAHEPIKATGIRRTYPNAISREGLRGQEFNAWASDGGNPPEHLPIVAFTRMLSGPIDYTPGIFNIKLNPYKKDNQVNTTLAQQLALYVVIYSPIQMVPDLMENYKGHPAFQFIREVAVDWETSKVLNGEVGDFVTIARQARDTEKWFVGGITDENARDMKIAFDFLKEGKTYKATLYKDGPDAHWDNNPTDYTIEEMEIDHNSKLNIHLAAGGGFAMSIMAE
ncbi:MAG: glycoside hydrolase family 97 protein [Bacteroidales bacterium]|nr:glycoside hydrolase family 97 protein [Bacteroidales bacterium]